MKEFVLQVVRGRRGGLASALARPLLSLLSVAYAAASGLRRLLYACGLRRRVKLPVPVVSVGNLTTGGTGKTPFVEFVARWFERNGLRVAILSRGYGRVPGVALDDEALSTESENVRRFTHPNRARLARQVIRDFRPDVVLLDDGFQHHRIRRDLDIVLIDALDPFSNGRLLPRGLLRERPKALRRADIIVITRSDQVDPTRLETIRRMLERISGGKPILEAVHRPVELEAPREGRKMPLEWLRTRELVAFSGIGNPEAFRLTLESLGAHISSHVTFPDHHVYGRREMKNLSLRVREFMAEGLVTTQKDAARLPDEEIDVSVFVLKVELRVARNLEALEERLAAAAGLREAMSERGLASTER